MTFKQMIDVGIVPEPIEWWDYEQGEGNELGRKRAMELADNPNVYTFAFWDKELSESEIGNFFDNKPS